MRRYARGELPDAYFYSRYANPTVAEVERKIAELEGAEACVVTSSGSAATFCALIALCEAGDEVIACDSVYGGTVKLLTKILPKFGVTARFIALNEVERLPELAGDRTRVFWFETPANPINRLVDLDQAAAGAARQAGVALGCRQHFCDADPAETDHSRHRCGNAQCHEISGRTFRSDCGRCSRNQRFY